MPWGTKMERLYIWVKRGVCFLWFDRQRKFLLHLAEPLLHVVRLTRVHYRVMLHRAFQDLVWRWALMIEYRWGFGVHLNIVDMFTDKNLFMRERPNSCLYSSEKRLISIFNFSCEERIRYQHERLIFPLFLLLWSQLLLGRRVQDWLISFQDVRVRLVSGQFLLHVLLVR